MMVQSKCLDSCYAHRNPAEVLGSWLQSSWNVAVVVQESRGGSLWAASTDTLIVSFGKKYEREIIKRELGSVSYCKSSRADSTEDFHVLEYWVGV